MPQALGIGVPLAAALRSGLPEGGHHMRQHMARLRVRCGHRQLILLAVGELLAEPLDAGRIGQHAFHDLHHLLTRIGEQRRLRHALSTALNPDVELFSGGGSSLQETCGSRAGG